MRQIKEVKLEDIAEALGVSIVTVSNALKGKKGVSKNLSLRIIKKAEELGYQFPEPAVKKEHKSYRIAVIIAERYVKEYPSFYMDIYKWVAQEAMKKGCLTVLVVLEENAEKTAEKFSNINDSEAQGIIVIGEVNEWYIHQLKQTTKLPLVCVDFYDTKDQMDYIVTDSYGGIQMVTQKLIDYGHRDIKFVGTPEATNSIMDRYLGFCKVMRVNGLREPEKEELIGDRRKDGYGYKIEFELPDKLPTAFVCNCDKSAYLMIEKLAAAGIRVPEDVSVVGFDGFGSGQMDNIALTTYESDRKAMAQISVNTLIDRMGGKGKTEGVRFVEGHMIDGDTIRKAKR